MNDYALAGKEARRGLSGPISHLGQYSRPTRSYLNTADYPLLGNASSVIRFTVHVSRLALIFPILPRLFTPDFPQTQRVNQACFLDLVTSVEQGTSLRLTRDSNLDYWQKPARLSELASKSGDFVRGKTGRRKGRSLRCEGQVSPSRGISNYATQRWRYCVPRNVPSPKGKPT